MSHIGIAHAGQDVTFSEKYIILQSKESPWPCNKVEDEGEDWEDWEKGAKLSIAKHQVKPWVDAKGQSESQSDSESDPCFNKCTVQTLCQKIWIENNLLIDCDDEV